MSKLIYAICQKDTAKKTTILNIGNTADYTRYTAYLMYLSRMFDVKNSKEFNQFYYAYFFNPEWKASEQYCQKTLPANKMTWFDRDLHAKLAQGYVIKPINWSGNLNLLQLAVKNDKLVNITKYQPEPNKLLFLAQVKPITQNTRKNEYQVVRIIKPQEIWKAQHQYQTYINIMSKHRFMPRLNKLVWQELDFDSINDTGAKRLIRKSANTHGQLRHLAPESVPRNYAMQVKREYDLPCVPKHMRKRHANLDLYDIYDMRCDNKWHRHDSWKNHKIKHQYEQHLATINY